MSSSQHVHLSVVFRAVISLLALTLLGACSSHPTYVVDHDESVDFSGLKTYRWYDDVHSSREAEYRHYNGSDKRIRTYVDREMKIRGLTEARSGQGDFWVNYNVSRQSKMRVNDISPYSSAGMHGGASVGTYGTSVGIGYSSGPSVREYKEGTFVLDIIDVNSKQVVWRGIAEASLPKSMHQSDRNKLASEVSRDILKDFPPRTGQ